MCVCVCVWVCKCVCVCVNVCVCKCVCVCVGGGGVSEKRISFRQVSEGWDINKYYDKENLGRDGM